MKTEDIIDKTVKAISTLKIQGATAVARESLKALRVYVRQVDNLAYDNLVLKASELGWARLTEPMARNCLAYVLWAARGLGEDKMRKAVIRALDMMLLKIGEVEKQVVSNFSGLIFPGMKVLTHCHSSLVEKVLVEAHRSQGRFFVYLTETRPMFQGRITARRLLKHGLDVKMVVDSAVGNLIRGRSGEGIDMVLLGCDAIARRGDCLNKIGSASIAEEAGEMKIPLFIVTTLLKFDPATKSTTRSLVEERGSDEIWSDAPERLRIENKAFDLIGSDQIKAYICEFGKLEPKKIYLKVKRNYPWIIDSGQKMNVLSKPLKRERFSYLFLGEKVDTAKHIIVDFRLSSKYPLDRAAQEVAAESSIGTWTRIGRQTRERFRKLCARVVRIDEKLGQVRIAYPLELFEKGNVAQLLSSVAGNVFGAKFVNKLRVEDLFLPEIYVRSFLGPALGLEGVRSLTQVKEGPLVGSIVKPKVGLDVEEHAEVASLLYKAGIDLVKDDENLTSQVFNQFGKRAFEILKLLKKIRKREGRERIYAFNVTGPADTIYKRARMIKEGGGNCVMLDVITAGFSALQYLRSLNLGLVIHGHRAMHAAFTRDRQHGISMLVVAKLCRLAGVDELHTGTVVGKMEGERAEVLAINNFLLSDWYGLKRVFPVASGGLYPKLVPNLLSILGQDIIMAFGGGIHGHKSGVRAGAMAVRQALEAVERGVVLEEYARSHRELKEALEMWPEDVA